MKKTALTICFKLICLTVLLSQTYNPLIRENSYWDENHGSGQHICFLSGGDRFYFEGDTTLNTILYGDTTYSSKLYKILKAHPLYAINQSPYCAPFGVNYSITNIKGYMREDSSSRQVFLLDGNTNIEYLLFDFSLIAGDTLTSMGVDYLIDSVKNITLIDGSTRKKWFVQSPNDAYYIEGVTGSEGLSHGFEVGLGYWEIPMCVSDNSVSIWGNECSTILGVNKIKELSSINAYPNPLMGNLLYLEIEGRIKKEAFLVDITGKTMLSIDTEFEKTFDLSTIPRGIYFIKMDGFRSIKIIKME